MAASYVKFEVPKEIQTKALEILETARDKGKIKKGVNEVIKSIERGLAKFVIIATDVTQPEIVMPLPMLCEEKKIPYVYVEGKEAIGKAAGLRVNCSAACIIEEGDKEALQDIINKINALKK